MYLLVQTLREMDPSVSTHLIPSNEHSTNGAENERNTCSSALIPVHNFSIVALSSFSYRHGLRVGSSILALNEVVCAGVNNNGIGFVDTEDSILDALLRVAGILGNDGVVAAHGALYG